jgi:hypothetical protein
MEEGGKGSRYKAQVSRFLPFVVSFVEEKTMRTAYGAKRGRGMAFGWENGSSPSENRPPEETGILSVIQSVLGTGITLIRNGCNRWKGFERRFPDVGREGGTLPFVVSLVVISSVAGAARVRVNVPHERPTGGR